MSHFFPQYKDKLSEKIKLPQEQQAHLITSKVLKKGNKKYCERSVLTVNLDI